MDKKQIQMKQQIKMMLNKKDYYDILGIQKLSTQTEIKKSYKKLALKFHPDKNSIEGSKQVFKKVSNAYSTLINTQKRSIYDKYGPQQQVRAQQFQQRQHYHNNPDQQFDQYQQIFRAFFGGMGNVRMHQNRQYQRTYMYNNNNNNNMNAGAQQQPQGFGLGYIFVIFFIIYTISPLFKSQPYYSFQLNTQYRFNVKTDLLSTQYYVRQQFFSQCRSNANLKRTIDLQVDQIYMTNLKKTCQKSTTYKKRLQYQAYQYNQGSYRDYYLTQANKVDITSCRKFNKLSQKQPQYVGQFFTRYR